jgi:hypothetical protein
MARARGDASAAAWQSFSRAGENNRRAPLGSSFVADL